MTVTELYNIRKKQFNTIGYSMQLWSDYDYSILSNIMYIKKAGRGNNESYNDVIIMLDTETSKKRATEYKTDTHGVKKPIAYPNHVVAFTVSIRAFETNIVTLYGHKPSELAECIEKIHDNMQGLNTIMYIHNLAYDWVFIRKFLFVKMGYPIKQLNTKSHYPISISFKNGIELRDSLILFQRSLDKAGKDFNVEHQKANGKWDYDKFRNQDEDFTSDELEYIEHDTLCGVECIDALKHQLNKKIYAMPYTSTGIPREEVRKRASENRGRDNFLKQCLSLDQYRKCEAVYHGGYTHANRHLVNQTLGSKDNLVQCYDFSSSYPFVLLSEKYPSSKFAPFKDCDVDTIIRNSQNYAFMVKFIAVNIRLKNDSVQMPALQFSKCVKSVNAICDNGRILRASLAVIYLNEMDIQVIAEQYCWDKHICCEVEFTHKDYLPRWFTDYIYECYRNKCTFKGGDAVAYAIAKSKVNALYGMTVQKPIKDDICEDYGTGEYTVSEPDYEELYGKYLEKRTSVLPYQWGTWCTSYAFYNLHQLGKCVNTWIYSDTDSCYGIGWNIDKVTEYNNKCKEKLLNNGYSAVLHNNKEYWLGVAEHEPIKDDYYEYRVMGAKRYCGRNLEDNELHITVAGVPKKGSICLNDNIENFTKGMIFSGTVTNKKTHIYIYADDIYTDENGNETGDSIDLSPCDYLLDDIEVYDWEALITENVEIQVFEEI